MDGLLLTDDADFEAALPALQLCARVVGRASLTDDPVGGRAQAEVAIIDARTDLAGARAACRRLTATAPAVAVVAVVAPADLVAVDANWHFDDVLLVTASAAELHARLRLAVARRRGALEGTLQFGDLVLHPASYMASLRGRKIDLTLTEFKLLNYLVQHAGQAITRPRLMREVWGQECCRRTVDVHVQRLRAKLGPDHESMVDTVRGVGYMVASPPHPRWVVGEPVLSTVWAS